MEIANNIYIINKLIVNENLNNIKIIFLLR